MHFFILWNYVNPILDIFTRLWQRIMNNERGIYEKEANISLSLSLSLCVSMFN